MIGHDWPGVVVSDMKMPGMDGMEFLRQVQAIDPDLPMVHVDRPRLLEALQNLIENAVRFMGDQSHPKVEIGARHEGDEIIFFVQAVDASGNVGMFAGSGYFAPIEVSVEGPTTAIAGQPVSFTVTHTLTDPAILWDFGDGTFADSATTVEHTFDAEGTFTIRVRVVDSHGAI